MGQYMNGVHIHPCTYDINVVKLIYELNKDVYADKSIVNIFYVMHCWLRIDLNLYNKIILKKKKQLIVMN